MEENENLKKELNEQQSEKISGGFHRYRDNGTFREKKTGKRYNSFCDFCDKRIEVRGSFLVPGDRHACINCYKKLNKMNPSSFKANPSDMVEDELA